MDFIIDWLPLVVLILTFIAGYIDLKGQVKENTKDIDKFARLLSSGEAGSPPFITDGQHVKLQAACQQRFDSRITGFERDITRMSGIMKEGDISRNAARKERQDDFTALREEVNGHHTQISVMVAGIKSDIKHLMQRRKG